MHCRSPLNHSTENVHLWWLAGTAHTQIAYISCSCHVAIVLSLFNVSVLVKTRKYVSGVISTMFYAYHFHNYNIHNYSSSP
uniref:Uncharacterized protein n=1 Tax=Anguilla anguilla TaxID=7936 RepID=A0A0E9UJW1_ANGAN